MLKRFVIMLALVGGFSMTGVSEADAWVVRRVAPVRRAARVALREAVQGVRPVPHFRGEGRPIACRRYAARWPAECVAAR